jgi:NRPS condensation-like uncharacterized protein
MHATCMHIVTHIIYYTITILMPHVFFELEVTKVKQTESDFPTDVISTNISIRTNNSYAQMVPK